MTDRELMQQALDALINAKGYIFHNVLDDKANQYDTAVEALRARLAQSEPEPVAWMYQQEDTGVTMCAVVQQVGSGFEKNNPRWQKIAPLYTAPPQREWQGLTDEEIRYAPRGGTFFDFARAIEAKLKEKNNG
jgi:hypothetical protein